MLTRRNDAAAELAATLKRMLPEAGTPYHLHEPELTAAEEARVVEALREGFVSYAGRHVSLFEQELAKTCGTREAVAIVSGTAAIQATLLALGIGQGDEVLCPSLTFVATANAIVHAGAMPHFVDCSAETLGLDPDRLQQHLARVATMRDGTLRNKDTGRRLAAIMPVHVFGHVGDMAGLRRVAENWNVAILEDATEALGSRTDDGMLFRFGVAAMLSFNGNKVVTTGGGGAVLTDDIEFARRLKHLTTTAKRPHAWRFDHDAVGYNHRMPNINAALGLAQLGRLDDFIARKRRLAAAYCRAFEQSTHWRFFTEPAGCASNYWLNVVMLSVADAALLETALAELHGFGYYCRPCWTPMHRLAVHADCPRVALPVTEDLAARIVCLPSSPKLAALID
jgi:perosamine synthetase